MPWSSKRCRLLCTVRRLPTASSSRKPALLTAKTNRQTSCKRPAPELPGLCSSPARQRSSWRSWWRPQIGRLRRYRGSASCTGRSPRPFSKINFLAFFGLIGLLCSLVKYFLVNTNMCHSSHPKRNETKDLFWPGFSEKGKFRTASRTSWCNKNVKLCTKPAYIPFLLNILLLKTCKLVPVVLIHKHWLPYAFQTFPIRFKLSLNPNQSKLRPAVQWYFCNSASEFFLLASF